MVIREDNKDAAESALAAERAKVRELREWLKDTHGQRYMVLHPDMVPALTERANTLASVIAQLDILGLTGEDK